MTMKPLTVQQERVLTFVEDYSQEHGFPPTLREIGEAIGLTNVNAVRGHVAALEKKGYVSRPPDKARSIQVLHSPSTLSRLKRKIHEVLGTDEGVLHRVVYGLAWTTWQRRPYFTDERREWISDAIDREVAEHGWSLVDKRIEPDHVILVVETWPNHSAEQTVRRFQAAGRTVANLHPDEFPGEALWGKGYVATTQLERLEEFVATLLGSQVQGGGEE